MLPSVVGGWGSEMHEPLKGLHCKQGRSALNSCCSVVQAFLLEEEMTFELPEAERDEV